MNARNSYHSRNEKPYLFQPFTLIELLLVIAIIAILAGLIMPALARARETGRRASCGSNLQQLTLANISYHGDYGRFIAVAQDIVGANLTRWHGKRQIPGNSQDFDFSKSALAYYMGNCKKVKRCPTFDNMIDFTKPSYEKGGGGYGYNELIGSLKYLESNAFGARASVAGLEMKNIAHPSQTIMFGDSACKVGNAGNVKGSGGQLTENSFLQSPLYVNNKQEQPGWGTAWPTMHFRHAGTVNITWVDGHLSTERMQWSNSTIDWGDNNLGWFGPADNTYFDPK